MSRYTNVKVNISDGQKQKLKSAIEKSCPVSIRLSYDDLKGEDILSLTKSQVNRMTKAYENGKGVTIKMSESQLRHNIKVEGGFLGLLAGLAARALPMLTKSVLPALGIGALSGLAQTGVQKLVGSGLYLKKGSSVYQLQKQGNGLYIQPFTGSGFKSVGDGLYLKQGKQLFDGKGLLLGPNSPFKNIPILNLLL